MIQVIAAAMAVTALIIQITADYQTKATDKYMRLTVAMIFLWIAFILLNISKSLGH